MVKANQKMVNYLNVKDLLTHMRAEEKIFLAFFELKKKKLYYNQIKDHTQLSHSSLQNVLENLLAKNLLGEEKTKSNKFYLIKNKQIVSLKFSEIAMNKFDNLNLGVKTPLRNFLKNLSQEIFTVVLFGSASRAEEQKGSDIDVLIVSNSKINLEENKNEAELTSKYPLSLFTCNTKQFLENKDPIIIQARKTGFPIYKEQNFYEVELNEY